MTDEQERGVGHQGQDRNQKEREAINNGFAALEGQKTVQSFSAFTFEEAVDLEIERIEGEGTEKRPNQLERVDRIEQQTLQAVAVLKEVPPEQFLDPDETEDVNTPSD